MVDELSPAIDALHQAEDFDWRVILLGGWAGVFLMMAALWIWQVWKIWWKS